MDGTCSIRLVRPFAAYAARQEALGDLVPPELSAMALDARVPLRTSQGATSIASERMRDPTLGLKLGMSLCFGIGGVFDYAVRSAATVKESLSTAARYSPLLASPFLVSLETRGRQSIIRVEDEIPWLNVMADFAIAGWYRLHAADELPRDAHAEIWLPYARPADTTLYDRVFAGATLRFGAPFLGMAFDERYENAPLPAADPVVHMMMCARADALLVDLTDTRPLTPLVRRLIAESLRDGDVPTVERVARHLYMSPRTVTRRLEREGVHFSTELDAARKALATTLVRQAELPLTDVAFRVGFSHSESFFRAFRRWTGVTPQSYRTTHDGEQPPGFIAAERRVRRR